MSRLNEPSKSPRSLSLMVRHDVERGLNGQANNMLNNKNNNNNGNADAPLLHQEERRHAAQHHLNHKEMRTQRIKLIVMISMTFFFFMVELVYGYLSNSMALIADSFHMLSDVLALCVALACIMIANRRTSANTFGWVRAELLGALVNGVFLLALCFSIFLESIERLVEPHPIKEPLNVLIVGIVGLIVNVIGMFLFHGHSHSHGHSHRSSPVDEEAIAGPTSYLASSHQDGAMAIAELDDSDEDLAAQKQNGNVVLSPPSQNHNHKRHNKNATQMNMKGVYLHIVTDFIGSIIVILTASISLWLPHLEILKYYMDPVLSMVMAMLIMSSTIPLVRETALILLQTTPDDVDVRTIEAQLMLLPGVLAVHEFHVWRLVAVRIIATVHIHFATFEDFLASAEKIRQIFHDHQVHSVTIQPEFTVQRKEDFGCVLKCAPEDCQAATCCQTPAVTSSSQQTPRTDR